MENKESAKFKKETGQRIRANGRNLALKKAAQAFMVGSTKPKYSYNFTWMGRPIIQYPQDMVAVQELIWDVKPDLIIETGIAHGGSLIFSASMQALLESCGLLKRGRVVGVDIDIRKHNRDAILAHPMAGRIRMIQGSSIAGEIVAQVRKLAKGYKKVMVFLDSNHTHAHVLAELKAYAPLVSTGSYCVVFDTLIEDMPPGTYPDRPWGRKDNPRTAVREYLKSDRRFVIDQEIHDKLLITVARDGYLKRTK